MERNSFVYAVFRDEKRAVRAVRGLIDAAFPTRDINALLRAGGSTEELAPAHHTGIRRGALLGAALGIGGGALVASGGLLIAGPLFIGLQGAALAGGALGSLLGTLAGLAHWNDQIEFPEHAFRRGSVLIGVTTNDGRAGLALEILLAAGGRRARVSTKREARRVARGQQEHLREPTLTKRAV
jgi:hypothetical protein